MADATFNKRDAEYMMRAMESFTAPSMSRDALPPICDYLRMYSRGAMPYPRQRTLLKIFFLEDDQFTAYDRMVIDQWIESTKNNGGVVIPLDIYERIKWCKAHGYRHFELVIYAGGRRSGKGFLGSRIVEYMMAQMISLGDPQKYYGIDRTHPIEAAVLATSFEQARSVLFTDIKDAILADDFLIPYVSQTGNSLQTISTPSDFVRDVETDAKVTSGQAYSGSSSLRVVPYAMKSSTVRGHANFFLAFDEFAHTIQGDSGMSSSEVYKAATPSLEQFGKDAMTYIPSSPWSQTGQFYKLYQDALATDRYGNAEFPTYFVFRAPSWEAYKDWQYDPDKTHALILSPDISQSMRSRMMSDPQSFDVEYRANFASAENMYFDRSTIESVFLPYPSAEDNRNVTRKTGAIDVTYRAHADAGRSQNNFAFAMGHSEVGEDGFLHAFIDVMKVWQPYDFPPDEHGVCHIDYTVCMDWFSDVFKRFYVSEFTMDQWNSAFIIDRIRRDSLSGKTLNPGMVSRVDNHGAKDNLRRWEGFKTACAQGWVHAPYIEQDIHGIGRCSLLKTELSFLVMKGGTKIDMESPGGSATLHDDMSDCVSTIVFDLLSDQITGLENGTLSHVVGAAHGGYNVNPDDPMTQWKSGQRESQAFWEQMGYGKYGSRYY